MAPAVVGQTFLRGKDLGTVRTDELREGTATVFAEKSSPFVALTTVMTAVAWSMEGIDLLCFSASGSRVFLPLSRQC